MPNSKNIMLDALHEKANDPRYADKIAVQQIGGGKLTYRQLMQKVDAISANLMMRGFQHGDRVLLLVRSSFDLMPIVLGVIQAGGAVIIGDPAMGKDTFEARMRFAQPKWVFAESVILLLQKWDWLRRIVKSRGVDLPEIGNMNIPNVVNVGSIPFLAKMSMRDLTNTKTVYQPKPHPLTPSPKFKEGEHNVTNVDLDLMIVFTSGTTAEPKGVVHTLKSVTSSLMTIADYLQLTEDDVFYSYALHLTIPALMAGGQAILPPRKPTAQKTLQAYRDFGITRTFEVPTHMNEITDYLQQSGEKLPQTLRDIMLGAAPVYADFLQKLKTVCTPNTRVWSVYGMTEILPACVISMDEKLAFDTAGGDIVGSPLKSVETSLADDGELILSGGGLFNRYLGQEPVTQHPTGDIARIDEQGRVILLGRKKDMIIRSNYNIYPSLFEPTIRQIPQVKDCALVGVYNPAKADEEIVLFVDSDTHDESLIRQYLLTGDYSIDVYAQPDAIFFREIPYSGRSRKADKKALRDDARQRLQIGVQSAEPMID